MTNFHEIDAARAAHGLTRGAVCRRAGIDPDTWRRTANGKTMPNVRTLRKLKDALDALVAEKEQGNG